MAPLTFPTPQPGLMSMIPSMGAKAKTPGTPTTNTTLPAGQTANSATTGGGGNAAYNSALAAGKNPFASNIAPAVPTSPTTPTSTPSAPVTTSQPNPVAGQPPVPWATSIAPSPNGTSSTPTSSSTSASTVPNTGLYGQLINNPTQANYVAAATNAYNTAGNTNQFIGELQQGALHNPDFSLDTGIGRAGQIGANYGLEGQNALTTAQGYAGIANTLAPTSQFGVLTNPLTGNPINGQSAQQAAINGGTIQGEQSGAATVAATGGNIASNFQTQIANTQAAASSADADFTLLNGYAQGFQGDTPILSQLQTKYANTVGGSAIISAFQSKLAEVQSEYTAITGSPPPATLSDQTTPNQLTQVQATLASSAQNKVAGLQAQMSSQNSSSSSSTTIPSGAGGNYVQDSSGTWTYVPAS